VAANTCAKHAKMADTTSLKIPLAVDMDGTLILSDALHEGLAGYLKMVPRELLSLLVALRAGKSAFKRHVAESVALDPQTIPYNTEVLKYLRAEKQAGRRIGLFTAADQSVADAVADHLDLFDVVQGSAPGRNFSGSSKAASIEAAFGPVFAYAGDHEVDHPIFERAASVLLVGPVDRLQAGLPEGKVVEARFPVAAPTLETWTRALRFKHWLKNLLLLVPALLAPPPLATFAWMIALFVLMGVLASATYLVNDLLDLAADRKHAVKRARPLASGALPISQATIAACLMIPASLLASLALPWPASLVPVLYLGITLAYSLVLKRLPMVDVTVLAGLFTLRVLAGSLMLDSPVSPWLLTFSMLFFLSLAVLKRYAEMERLLRTAPNAEARGYTHKDVPILLATGVGSALSATVIFMLYLMTDQYPRPIYIHPWALWGVMPILLLWMLGLWHRAVHGQMTEDPVIFAVTDRMSLMLGGVVLLMLLVARV
jgi:4-hydroxybenzoate polyprenyltransferase